MNKDKTITEAFQNVFDELKARGKINGTSDFARNINQYPHIISSYYRGKRNIALKWLFEMCHVYNLNANYFFGRSTEMFLTGSDNSPSDVLMAKYETLISLKGVIDKKLKEIEQITL